MTAPAAAAEKRNASGTRPEAFTPNSTESLENQRGQRKSEVS